MKVEICGNLYTLNTTNKTPQSILTVLCEIKRTSNRSLSFKSGCRSGVCGSCAIKVNGVEKLACKTLIKDSDSITPLNNLKVIKDLIVEDSNKHLSLKTASAHLTSKSDNSVSIEDERIIDRESNCILCNICVSACPVYSINSNFIAPFALIRNYRYINDTKENNISSKIDSIQDNGIWDCTLCGNCNLVCPSYIDIKGDIESLRNKSALFGYNNPNTNIGFDANMNFGFNPNEF